ncbi:hypothetical protein HanXRQr2_Chr05g0230301 [Helianthus annuus]|uniref:Uncharacterized protein n=1 Tax=Helianthus annuus TaxID=4232 RepID=A0A9K3J1Q5_HELAN|nr:hypothetical protein HanXRQr2_Chr05g0230301 [Helianthus annuus]KAJ0585672.1 hypothetical protein HanHA89_Chr05g0203381 [Helianthus annuus]KAJ0923911.1 hypothetical protein HanPSC8_Chr05g0222161 [Helianthus annuus]
MTKFFGEVLSRYGLHISQINTLGLPRVTHFEFICRAQRLIPLVDMFNVFYYVSHTGGFYSFNSRTANVLPYNKDSPKSLHDCKHKFFYIRRGIIPIDMHYHSNSEGVPKLQVCSHADQQWYKTLTRTPTAMLQLDEKALVATGMSLLWLPKNPRAAPIYAYKDKAYNLMNALDPEVGGEMVTQLLPEGEIPWVEQIQDNFLHPTPESLNTYIAIPTGARPLVSTSSEVGKSPTREGVILL